MASTSAGASTDSYISLLTHLLSPAGITLPESITSLVAFNIATTPSNTLQPLFHALATSSSLWEAQAFVASDRPPPLLSFERVQQVFGAVVRGTLGRVETIKKELGSGWRCRKRLAADVGIIVDSVNIQVYDVGNNEVAVLHPLIRVIITSGILSALQNLKSNHDTVYVSGRKLLPRVEDATLTAWVQLATDSSIANSKFVGWSDIWEHSRLQKGHLDEDEYIVIPCWLAVQVFPSISKRKLRIVSIPPLFDLFTGGIALLFDEGCFMENLDDDLSTTSGGNDGKKSLEWKQASISQERISRLTSNPLSTLLSPLSRSISLLIESIYTPTSLNSCISQLSRFETIVQKCHLDYALTKRPSETEAGSVWTLLRTLLFSVTMIYSSTISLLTDRSVIVPNASLLEISELGLSTFQWLYFVTTKFGQDGFSTYKNAWWGLIDALGRESTEKEVEAVVRRLEPDTRGTLDDDEMSRSRMTHYLNVVEPLIINLPDDYIEIVILPCLRPYLDNPKYKDTFESAHSVILALFTNDKRIVCDIAPYYVELLLHSYPDRMSATQLRLAFKTTIKSLSNTSDPIAWYCIKLFSEEIISLNSNLDISKSNQRAINSQSGAETDASDIEKQPQAVQEGDKRIDKESTSITTQFDNPLTLESDALYLRRGHLLLALIDSVAVVNLVLFHNILNLIWTFILEEEEQQPPEPLKESRDRKAKDELWKVLFETLAGGLDSTKREEGVRWWLRRRSQLLNESKAAHL